MKKLDEIHEMLVAITKEQKSQSEDIRNILVKQTEINGSVKRNIQDIQEGKEFREACSANVWKKLNELEKEQVRNSLLLGLIGSGIGAAVMIILHFL